MWTMTSVISPWSCQPVSNGTRIKWPEEEIGRNSVIPWIKARTMICSIGMPALTLGRATGPANRLLPLGLAFYMEPNGTAMRRLGPLPWDLGVLFRPYAEALPLFA